MQQKNNPWIFISVFLIGLIVGFGIQKFIPTNGNMNTDTSKVENSENSEKQNNIVNEDPENQYIESAPAPDYSKLQVSKTKEGNYALGSPQAKVVIEEFSDFECPFCKRYFNESFSRIAENYIAKGNVYYIFYDYPLSIHPRAPKASEAAFCAGDQNKYWEMHDLLFQEQDNWRSADDKAFTELATKLNLNTKDFENCMQTNKYTAQVQKGLEKGQSKEVSGTPTFFINGTKVVGSQPYESLQKVIEGELNK